MSYDILGAFRCQMFTKLQIWEEMPVSHYKCGQQHTILAENQPFVLKQFDLPTSQKMALPIHNQQPTLIHHLVQPIFEMHKTMRQLDMEMTG
jgi:hypothetical protein